MKNFISINPTVQSTDLYGDKKSMGSTRRRTITMVITIALLTMFSLQISLGGSANASTPVSGASDSVDMFFMGDSWTAYAGQSGSVAAACTFAIFDVRFTGLPLGTCPNVPLFGQSCYGGCGSVAPDFKGGLTAEGIIRDRLNARGIPYSKVIKHEYAVGGTLASQWAAQAPTSLLAADASGYWTGLATELAASTKPIVFLTLGGNDLFPYGTLYQVSDTTNWNVAMATIQGNIDKVIQYLVAINPNVEIVMPSYTNMKIVDGQVTRFPQTGSFGFCRELFAANANGSMFYATSYAAYETAASAWANGAYASLLAEATNNWDTVRFPSYYNSFRSSYISTNTWRVTLHQISNAQLQAEANNYGTVQANGFRSDTISNYMGGKSPGYYLSPLSLTTGENAYQQSSVISAATASISEQGINPVMQMLDTVDRAIAAKYSANMKYIPVWATISTEDTAHPQAINKYASAPRSEFADCIHLNSDGYGKWADRILNQWLPQSKYLNMR